MHAYFKYASLGPPAESGAGSSSAVFMSSSWSSDPGSGMAMLDDVERWWGKWGSEFGGVDEADSMSVATIRLSARVADGGRPERERRKIRIVSPDIDERG